MKFFLFFKTSLLYFQLQECLIIDKLTETIQTKKMLRNSVAYSLYATVYNFGFSVKKTKLTNCSDINASDNKTNIIRRASVTINLYLSNSNKDLTKFG